MASPFRYRHISEKLIHCSILFFCTIFLVVTILTLAIEQIGCNCNNDAVILTLIKTKITAKNVFNRGTTSFTWDYLVNEFKNYS